MSDRFKREFKNSVLFLLKLLLLFFVLITVFRTIFILYYYDKLQLVSNSFSELLSTYYHGFALDLATSSILISIPWLIIFLDSILKIKYLKNLLHIYTLLAITLSSFIYIAELGVYNEWEEKPTFKVLNYLKHPSEAINSNPLEYTIILTAILLMVLALFHIIIKRVFESYKSNSKRDYRVMIILFLIVPIFILLGARGGWGLYPISQSDVYFSKHKVYNDTAINTVYNFLHSISENYNAMSGVNEFKLNINDGLKDKVLSECMATDSNCSYPSILTTTRPNVVLIVWESLAGDFINNEKYKTAIPNLENFSKEGVYFTKAYSSATLSHEGMPAIFSAWPALYDRYITNLPSKASKMPTITGKLNENGYNSMFLFGGELVYGNMTSYMYGNNFDVIQEGRDIKMDVKRGKLGIPDEFMFEYFRKKTGTLNEPFFSSLYTLSSHSPYDQPMEDVFDWGGRENGYINSIYYTDRSLGEFIKKAREESWYDNTLFIVVPDHSHKTTLGWARTDTKWHHVPILFFGNVIKEEYKGMRYEKVMSQSDIIATLLAQMKINHDGFLWSRNVFCKNYKESAYTMAPGGFGIVEKDGSIVCNLKEDRVLHNEGNTSGLKLKGNIYVEKLLQTYLDY